ncbi:Bacterial Ig-like domain (group 2) [uncultured archaeon]|nr:Bacterial Ig-like domain (group 2) [uncultured archaeon]
MSPTATSTSKATPTPTATTPAPKLTTITVSPSNASVAINNTKTFTASTKDQFGNPMTVPVSWSSSNISIGLIDSSGVFKGITPGIVTITASSGNVSGTVIAIVIETGYRLWLVAPREFSDTLQENTYKMNFIVNPASSGSLRTEENYNVALNVYNSGVGGGYSENGFKLYLVPELAYFSYLNDITVNDPWQKITPKYSIWTLLTTPIDNLLNTLKTLIGSIL